MSPLFLGIDIGVQGAIAMLDGSGDLIEIADMPVLAGGPAGRRSVNAPLLAEVILKSHASGAFVEFVGARPGEGAVGAFAFGRSRGVIEGVLGACSVPIEMITPAHWKRLCGLSLASKDAARSEAIRRWPRHASLFARVKDADRAESALIAIGGLIRRGAL
jgi:crossover junction endodeoxyribonuclease RuvC